MGKGLKGLFFEDDTPKDDKTAKKEVAKPTTATQTSPTQQVPVSITNVIGSQGVVDSKFVEMLREVIKANNIAGFDYFEFRQAIDAMGNLAIAEKDKFMTAYNIYSQQGCDKERLLSSLEKYISLIQTEQKNFDAELDKQYQIRVQAKINSVDEAKEELVKLNNKITELNAFVLKTSQEVQQEQSTLEITASNFKKSADVVLNDLLSDKEKINTLIK